MTQAHPIHHLLFEGDGSAIGDVLAKMLPIEAVFWKVR
jgi:hypothetical protein